MKETLPLIFQVCKLSAKTERILRGFQQLLVERNLDHIVGFHFPPEQVAVVVEMVKNDSRDTNKKMILQFLVASMLKNPQFESRKVEIFGVDARGQEFLAFLFPPNSGGGDTRLKAKKTDLDNGSKKRKTPEVDCDDSDYSVASTDVASLPSSPAATHASFSSSTVHDKDDLLCPSTPPPSDLLSNEYVPLSILDNLDAEQVIDNFFALLPSTGVPMAAEPPFLRSPPSSPRAGEEEKKVNSFFASSSLNQDIPRPPAPICVSAGLFQQLKTSSQIDATPFATAERFVSSQESPSSSCDGKKTHSVVAKGSLSVSAVVSSNINRPQCCDGCGCTLLPTDKRHAVSTDAASVGHTGFFCARCYTYFSRVWNHKSLYLPISRDVSKLASTGKDLFLYNCRCCNALRFASYNNNVEKGGVCEKCGHNKKARK